MNRNNPWFKTILVAAIGGGVLVCLALAAVLIVSNGSGQNAPAIARLLSGNPEPPTITILRPSAPQTITSGQGAMVVARVQAQDGIQYVEFLVDNVPEKQVPLARTGEVDEEVRFAWFASKAGVHVLSLVAYDNGGQASIPASLTLTVEQNRRAFELEAEAEEAAAQEEAESETAAGEGEETSTEEESAAEEEPPAEGEAEAPEEEAAPEESAEEEAPPVEEEEPEAPEPEGEEEPEPPEVPEEAEPEDAVPEITLFEVDILWGGGDVEGEVIVEAADDIGLMAIVVDWLNDDGEHGTEVRFCGDDVTCHMAFIMPLHNGEWIFSAQAYDNAGQVSIPVIESRDVFSLSGLLPFIGIIAEYYPIIPEDDEPEESIFDLWEYLGILLELEILPGSGIFQEMPLAVVPETSERMVEL